MKLSKNMKKLLLDELRFVIDNMNKSENAIGKMYFFSAAYGATNRIMNIEYDSELVFIHNVLSAAHSTINQRIVALASGAELAVGIPENIFDKLVEALEEIIAFVQKDESTYTALEKISNVAYSTTGNGYYLYLRGKLLV
ncbi:MAG: hypothetical protein U9Q97_05345 [Acidobacteriota bacterium]|nr:hypothetical protein [Acidobacteriota bacterium]